MVTAPSTTFAVRSPTATAAGRVAGFLGSGMLDWPGRVAATVFLSGCPLRCPYCHNPELVSGKCQVDRTEEFLGHVRRRRDWLDGVVITGGEPTADPGLIGLLHDIRREGLPVKLDTNGVNPAVLERLLAERLVDFVAMDVKCIPERYEQVTGAAGAWDRVRQSIRAVIESGVDHEFRTTCYPLAVSADDPVRIASHLGGGRRLVLQQFRPQRTLDAGAVSVRPHAPEVLRRAADSCRAYLPTAVRGI